MLLICYFADNLKYSIISGPSVGQRIEQFKETTRLSKDKPTDEFVFVNVAYDRMLVPVLDEFGFPQGNIDISDRDKLRLFLSQLNDSHKYVLMDVLLSDRYKSDSDSALVKTLKATDRLSISRSSTGKLIDTTLSSKAGYTDYSTDIYETNFVKYEFLNSGEATMPYLAYQTLNPMSKIHKFGPIHWSNGHLYWNSLTLRFPIKLWNDRTVIEECSGLQEKKILNLGSDILEMGIDIPSLVKDKIVVIGDFTEDDIHDTYIGKIAGPVINIKALDALINNELEIPWPLVLFLFSVYTVIGYMTIRQPISTNKILTKLHLNNSVIRYILSFIGYSFLLTVIGGGIYLMCGIDINIILPSL